MGVAESLRVLLVEDEIMVAMMVEDILAELGHTVVGTAMQLEPALVLAREAAVDVAILDVNLEGGVQTTAVAEVLRGRNIPFLYSTGYGRAALAGGPGGAVVLPKPFTDTDLQDALKAALAAEPRTLG
jgi:CheY-like chemotaxis protein